MRLLIIFLIFIHSLSLYSQPVDLYGGMNQNRFYGANNNPHFNAKYHPGNGFSAGIGIDSIKLDWLTMRFTLQFDRYKGEFSVSDGGQGGGTTTSANIKNSVVSLGAFPLNFSIRKRVTINFGAEVSTMINESFSGTKSNWQLESTPSGHHAVTYTQDLNELYDRFSSRTNFGLKARIAYDITLTKRLFLVPQYAYYLGISKQFIEFPDVTKSMRHTFCLGIKRK